jgi:hypothetical protein
LVATHQLRNRHLSNGVRSRSRTPRPPPPSFLSPSQPYLKNTTEPHPPPPPTSLCLCRPRPHLLPTSTHDLHARAARCATKSTAPEPSRRPRAAKAAWPMGHGFPAACPAAPHGDAAGISSPARPRTPLLSRSYWRACEAARWLAARRRSPFSFLSPPLVVTFSPPAVAATGISATVRGKEGDRGGWR